MPRTSVVHYIAPSAISIVPNANGTPNDLAVYVARDTKIMVYAPKAGIDVVDASYQEWTMSGRNRRLDDDTKPYTIYARLSKTDKNDGYLVFAKKVVKGNDFTDKYPYVTINGLSSISYTPSSDVIESIENYWYIRIGEVTIPENGERTLVLDTGILGTDQYNSEWQQNPDELRPSRVLKEDRGLWTDTPTAVYQGLDVTVDGHTYHDGDTIDEPYHYRSFTHATWLQYRGSDTFEGISDEQLYQLMMEYYHVDLEISQAWRYDALWECKRDLTTEEPMLGCEDWVLLRMPTISLPFFDGDGLPLLVMPVHSEGVINETVVPKLMFGQYDFSEAVTAWQWERESDYPDLDAIWNAQARARRQELTLVNADFPSGWWTGTLSWKCTAWFDGVGDETMELTNVITV